MKKYSSHANVKIDATVLAFTLLISLATGLLFGLAPALRAMKENLVDALKDGMRGGSEATLKNRTRSLLVVLESAIAVMLLIGAGLLIRSLLALQNVDPGFDPNNVLTMRVDLALQKYNTRKRRRTFSGSSRHVLPAYRASKLSVSLPTCHSVVNLTTCLTQSKAVRPLGPI